MFQVGRWHSGLDQQCLSLVLRTGEATPGILCYVLGLTTKRTLSCWSMSSVWWVNPFWLYWVDVCITVPRLNPAECKCHYPWHLHLLASFTGWQFRKAYKSQVKQGSYLQFTTRFVCQFFPCPSSSCCVDILLKYFFRFLVFTLFWWKDLKFFFHEKAFFLV